MVTGVSTALFALTVNAATLDEVKEKGEVTCGLSQGLPGFSNPDDQGNWSGLDAEYCQALSAAIFGDKTKAKFVPLSAKNRFTALTSGEIDILPRNTTWTISRDADFGDFIGVNYYDGQGFMVRKDLGITSATELSGATVCTNTGTTTELNVADYFRANGMDYQVVAFEKAEEVLAAYEASRCDVFTTDRSGIAAHRTKLASPDEHIVLDEIISKEPLGPMVRHGDNQWKDVAAWTLNCMINAEEFGITSANVEEMKSSDNPDIKRMLGADDGDLGTKIGLSNDWCANVIAEVGNYAESYNRTVGPDTPLGLARGLNALPRDGGILYAPPIR